MKIIEVSSRNSNNSMMDELQSFFCSENFCRSYVTAALVWLKITASLFLDYFPILT